MRTVRSAAAADIPALAAYEREISLISFGDEAVTDLGHHASRLAKAMEKDGGGMFVMEENGALCGWLWMEMKINFLTQERYANFRSFYLAEPVRGTDAGDRLLSHGLDWCRAQKARRVVGKVHAGNAPMRALYKTAGFAATHVTMERTLP